MSYYFKSIKEIWLSYISEFTFKLTNITWNNAKTESLEVLFSVYILTLDKVSRWSTAGERLLLNMCKKRVMFCRGPHLKVDRALRFHNSPQAGRTTVSVACPPSQKSTAARVLSKHALQTCVIERQRERKQTDLHFLLGGAGGTLQLSLFVLTLINLSFPGDGVAREPPSLHRVHHLR